MKGLNRIALFCPHFCKGIGIVECKVDPSNRKSGNPFEKTSKYPIKKNILLMEHIDKANKLCSYIKNTSIGEDVIYSTVKQVLLGILIAQRKTQFTHYDLHSDNVMLRKCSKNLVFLYVIDEHNQYAVPSNGYYPVIIDYGFSYIKDMQDNALWPSMAHTDIGFISDRFDWLSDPKLFLVTVSSELKEERGTKSSKKFRKIVRNLFYPLKIDWEAGWDDLNDMGAIDYVSELLSRESSKSELFKDYHHYCFDIIQTLITLPLTPQNSSNIKVSYKAFLQEFVKIENEIGSPFFMLYILKGIVDSARKVSCEYWSGDRKKAISTFRHDMYEKIEEVTKFCSVKNMNYEIMLCSLYVLSKNMEGVIYEVINERMKDKQKEYNKLPVQSIEQIFGVISTNIPCNYTYSNDTTVLVLDCVKELCYPCQVQEKDLEELNNTDSLSQGTFLYSLYCDNELVN
jgi:hypothetical protein